MTPNRELPVHYGKFLVFCGTLECDGDCQAEQEGYKFDLCVSYCWDLLQETWVDLELC